MASLCRRIVLFSAFVSVVTMLYWYITEPYGGPIVRVDPGSSSVTIEREYTGSGSQSNDDKSTCQFPDFDPFNSHAMKFYVKHPTKSCPNGMPTITYYNGEVIRVNHTHKQKTSLKDITVQCWYRTVTYQRRVDFVNGPWLGPFDDVITVKDKTEFVEVKCEDSDGKLVSKMHHYIVREEERKKLKPPEHKEFGAEKMNILMLCMDSMAHYLFKRAMPLTRNYILQNLEAIEMEKYNKIGSATLVNLIAAAAGVYEEDLGNWTEAQGFDPVPFLWKRYKALGYRTQYMSDQVDFDDFTRSPTDSFNMPMTRALMKDKIRFKNDCFEDKVEVKLWLDLILEFGRESIYSTGRFFSFAMIERPTHDFPNEASGVDEHYYNFFKEAHETGLLNNTFVVFFGDHGPRIEAYRRTFYGSIEERFANMIIIPPLWFKYKYPTHYKNLKINSGRLTTNFDVHHTVRNLHLLPDIVDKSEKIIFSKTGVPRAHSLFSEISPQRTCDDASLSPHWCLCYGGIGLRDEKIKQELGAHVVKDLNALLQPKSDLCATLELKVVTQAVVLSGMAGKTAMYRIMLETNPGGATFEATVQYIVKLYFFTSIKTLGSISRTDLYRGQSDCVQEDKLLKMYCYCKDVLAKQNQIA